MAATCELLAETGADVVGAAVVIELGFLDGARRVGVPLQSVLVY